MFPSTNSQGVFAAGTAAAAPATMIALAFKLSLQSPGKRGICQILLGAVCGLGNNGGDNGGRDKSARTQDRDDWKT